TRHLAQNRQGPLRHPPAEARRLETAPDSCCVPTPDRARSPVEEPRASPKRPRGLTAPAPAVDQPQARGSFSDTSQRSAIGGSVCVDRRVDRSRGDGDRGSGAGNIGGPPPHHQATEADAPPRRDERASNPARGPSRVREDDPGPRVALDPPFSL